MLKGCSRQRAKASMLKLPFYSAVEGDEKEMRKVRNVLCTHHLLCSVAPHIVGSSARVDAMERSPRHWPSGTGVVLLLVGCFVPAHSTHSWTCEAWFGVSPPSHTQSRFLSFLPARPEKQLLFLFMHFYVVLAKICLEGFFHKNHTQAIWLWLTIALSWHPHYQEPSKCSLQVQPSWILSNPVWKIQSLRSASKNTFFLLCLPLFLH